MRGPGGATDPSMKTTETPSFRDESGSVSPGFVAALDLADVRRVRAVTRDLHAADLADLISALDRLDRVRLIKALGRNFDVEALAELDEAARDEVIESLPPETIAAALRHLETDDAAYLLEDLDEAERAAILGRVSDEDRAAIGRALEYEEGTAGRLMSTEFVAVPSFWTVGRTIDYLRAARDLPDDFVEVYVVDPAFHLTGTVPASRILRSPRATKIEQIADAEQVVFRVGDRQDDIAIKFERYNLVSAAVTDADGRLVGTLMVDDIVEVIHEEAEEDMLALGGVGEEKTGDSFWRMIRARVPWLSVNLLTGLLAAAVISLFGASIQQMVALAVIMPIVASMGGNAGTQTMTVTVRALATRNLGPLNMLKSILRECGIGLANGVLFAAVMGLIAAWWFSSESLGTVVAAATAINLLAAALAGILIPLTLDRLKIDPAVSSGVFVTMVTDVVGFFSFLGLATVWLL
jgi:magnesium transporter